MCCCPKSKWGLDQAVVAFVIADDPRLTQNQALSATVITDDSEFTQNLAVSALVIADGSGLAQNLAVSAIVIADGSGLAQNLVVSAIVIADDPRLTPESGRIGDCAHRRPQAGPPLVAQKTALQIDRAPLSVRAGNTLAAGDCSSGQVSAEGAFPGG